MRDRAPVHSVPNPNFAGELRGYRQQWTVPSVEDLARNRAPLYLPGDDPARDNPENSPWKPNYRNQRPLLPGPQSSLPGAVSDRRAGPASSSAQLPPLAALGHASVQTAPADAGRARWPRDLWDQPFCSASALRRRRRGLGTRPEAAVYWICWPSSWLPDPAINSPQGEVGAIADAILVLDSRACPLVACFGDGSDHCHSGQVPGTDR